MVETLEADMATLRTELERKDSKVRELQAALASAAAERAEHDAGAAGMLSQFENALASANTQVGSVLQPMCSAPEQSSVIADMAVVINGTPASRTNDSNRNSGIHLIILVARASPACHAGFELPRQCAMNP